jgi:hypothetical protein
MFRAVDNLLGAIVVSPNERSAIDAAAISTAPRHATFALRNREPLLGWPNLADTVRPAEPFERPWTPSAEDAWVAGPDPHSDTDPNEPSVDRFAEPFEDQPTVQRPVPYSFVIQTLLDEWLEEAGRDSAADDRRF